MRSLRARLTLAYASLFAAALIAVAVLGVRLEFEALAHQTLDATETSVRIAETIVAAHPSAPPGLLEGEIATEARRDGVVVRIPGPNRGLGSGSLPEGPRGFENLSIASLLGLRPHTVPVGPDTVIIAPDLERLRPAINLCGTTLAVSVFLAIALAWIVARWITGLAIRPLLTVTAELRRFAGGDFTPREVRTNDREELGALIAAYNGATAKVAEAFDERRDVEQHMRRFVADAGHELRTPLTVIDGYVQILRKAPAGDMATRERALITLQAQTARMRTLVERLMVLARLERPERPVAGEVDVAAIAADAIAGVTSARGGHVVLEADAAPRVVAEAADLHEAVGNLVDNAVKYGAGSDVLVSLAAREDAVVVRVRDGGPGIPADERDRIFERFFRGDTQREVEGSGLGLAIVERAVARCGGRVVLERADPGETVFMLELPASRVTVRDVTPLEV
jgi:two-component system OmpR family sensor kinase